MTQLENGEHKLGIRISDYQFNMLGKMLGYGEYQALYRVITDSLIELYLKHGKTAIHAVLSGNADFIRILLKQKEETNGHD